MTAPSRFNGPSGGSLAPLFPVPLVGAAVLLAILIVLTPNLLSAGQPSAGSAESQLELLVDRAPTADNDTHLYLRGLGLVRYQSLVLTWGNLSGGAPRNLSGVRWSEPISAGPALELETAVPSSDFAVNVTGVFVDTSGLGVEFSGEFAFAWSGGTLLTTAYGGASGAGPTAPSSLPLILLLPEYPYGGGP